MKAALKHRSVLLLWAGLSWSAVGDQLYTVALSWISVDIFGAAAGYITALGCFTLLMTALLAGGWADRWPHRRAMIGADLTRAATLLLVVAGWLVAGHPSPLALALAVMVLGAGQAVFRPAMQGLIPALAPPHDLPATNALFDSTDRIARMLGPGLVGLLAAVVPTRHFLTLDALTFLASAGAIRAVRPPGLLAHRPHRHRQPVLAGIQRGWRALARHDLLRFLHCSIGVINGGWYASLFLGLPLAIAHHGVTGPGGSGLGAYGLVISCYGCTNLAAMLFVGHRPVAARPIRQIFAGNLLLGGGMVLLGLAPLLPPGLALPGLCAAAALAAPGGPMQDIPLAVLRQTQLPRRAVPSVMRVYLVISNTGMLLGMAVAPSLFAASLPGGMALCGLAVMAMGVLGFARFTRRRDTPVVG